MENKSKFLRLDWVDIMKSLRLYAVVFVGFLATILLSSLPAIQEAVVNTLNGSSVNPVVLSLVMAIVPTMFEAIRRFLTDYSKQ